MKKQRLFLLGLLMVMLTVCSATAFAGPQDFTLVNNTGYPISEIYVSPSNDNDWQEDVMGKDVLGNGESVDITFGGGERATYWDIKAVFSDGSSLVWTKFNLKTISTITLKANGDASYQ